jgi:hypothetical protein
MIFAISNILSTFETNNVIGSRVTDQERFFAGLTKAVAEHDKGQDRTEGQHFVHLPEELWDTVSAGVGQKTANPTDYVIRTHRGQPAMYLHRDLAAKVEGLACIVYTREAYLADPDVRQDTEELKRIENSDCSHVIVAVLAFAGPKAPLTPYRLVHNLAGGNRDCESWTMDDVRQKAQESKEYWDSWAVVAD